MNIPFTNLYQQYLDCQAEIDQAIQNTIASSSFITGPDVTRFESIMSEYVGSEDCAGTGSGTTALLCALRAGGIGPGDEVITPPNTFIATQATAALLGAKIVFADIELETGLINLECIERSITKKTKAIVLVDYAGQPCDVESVRELDHIPSNSAS